MTDHANSGTIVAFLVRCVASRADEPALGFIRNGRLHWRTWREVANDAAAVATVIEKANIKPGERVAHVSENRYEWVITDLAIHLANAVHVPIHVTLSGRQIAEQIADCDAQLVFVSSSKLLAVFAEALPPAVTVIVHDEPAEIGRQTRLGMPAAALGQPSGPDDLATILYTSGTTGRPRGVMLSQRNLAHNAATTADAHGGGTEQTRLCVLPLSHIYARTCDLYTWVYGGSRLVLAESRDTLARDCQLAQPTALNAVPYVYQRIAEMIAAARKNEDRAALREFFGGRMERLSSGGAALPADVEAWYAARGLPVLQGYGLTESSPVVSVSTPSANRFGSVGQPLPGLEVRVAEDGEILVRGPNVMLGYWHDEAATAEVIRGGWLQTGDLGELDADGFLFIRGRKKELIVLSTGKNVVPTRVEGLLTASPLIEQAAVFGDGQCGLVALIVPATRGLTRDVCGREIAARLAVAAREEQIRKFAILERPFSIDRGELTPKLSLCRRVIAQNFASHLRELAPPSAQIAQSYEPGLSESRDSNGSNDCSVPL